MAKCFFWRPGVPRPKKQYVPEQVWFFGLGTPGLQKTTWPIHNFGIPLMMSLKAVAYRWASLAIGHHRNLGEPCRDSQFVDILPSLRDTSTIRYCGSGPGNSHETALELVSGVNVGCVLHHFSSPTRWKGSRVQVRPVTGQKSNINYNFNNLSKRR